MESSTGAARLVALNTNLLESGKYSDLTIICKEYRFRVHRNIVCGQSKVLAAAIDGDFKEAETGEYDFDDCDSGIVKKFLEYLYLGNYHENQSAGTDNGEDGPLVLHVKLYVMADRYDVHGLKAAAKEKYGFAIAMRWNDPSLASSLELLYSEITESDLLLKDIALRAVGQNAKALIDRDEFATLCKKNGEIAFDVLKASLGAYKIR